MGPVKHRCGQSPAGPDPVDPRPGPAPADRGFNEVNDVDPEQAVKIAEDEAIEWRDRAKEVESERDALAARLAEVEAERDGVSMQNDLAGEQLREMAAERDRLAQELEGALGHLRGLCTIEGGYDKVIDHPVLVERLGEANRFLARFPVKEGDET